MEKKAKSLILCLVFLVVLLCLLVLVKHRNTTVDSSVPTSEEPASTTPVITFTKDEIKEITVKEGDSSLTYLPTTDSWTIKGLDNVELDTTSVNFSGNSMLSIEASQTIESSNLSDFGLDQPLKIIVYSLKDGSTVKLFVGKNTADNNQTYIKTSLAEGSIYTIPTTTSSTFKSDLSKLRITKLDSVDTSTITALTLKGKDMSEISISIDPNATGLLCPYIMKFDGHDNISVDYNAYSDLLKSIPSFTVEGFVADNVTDFAPYGLDDPSLVIALETTVYDTETSQNNDVTSPTPSPTITKLTYSFGDETSDGMIYFTKDGSSSVYAMSNTFLADLKQKADPYTLIDKSLALIPIDSVSKIDIIAKDKSYTLAITDDKYTLNNKSVDEATFKSIYTSLIGITADTELAVDKASASSTSTTKDTKLTLDDFPQTVPEITITYTLTTGDTQTYQLYPYNDQFYIGMLHNSIPAGFNIKQFTHLFNSLNK